LTELGFHVSFSEHAEEMDLSSFSSISSRVADLHTAFVDPNVRAVLTAIGGYNSNQLLKYLDYELIRRHPKIFAVFPISLLWGRPIMPKRDW
jgi:muramoyltetrapeptide carboxypeptidase LdcA involved in peptidoglycan recycling